MLLPVMTGSANINDRRLVQQENLIRSVGGMAGHAFSFLHRRMLVFQFLQPVHRVGMALCTGFYHWPNQKGWLVRGMGAVTVKAACSIKQRPMQAIFRQGLIDHVAVTAEAELITRFFGLERVRRGWIFMALVAHFLGKW